MSLKYLSRVSVLTILAVGVVACSSSGNNSFSNPSTVLPPSSEQTEAEKEEAERLESIETNRVALLEKAKTAGLTDQQAAAYAEANKTANETDAQAALNTLVAEKIAAEKAEADRIAAEKAEADRIAAEKAEADRIAAEKAEADRIAAEKAEADRIAAEKAEADRIAAEKAEADRIAAEKAEADRIAAEKAEAERLQKIETNRVALLAKAKTAGLNNQQAAAYAEANKEATDKVAQTALETLVAEKAAADKAAADKAAAEKAEAERLQKIEANRLALLDKAKKAGLSAAQAAAYAEANKEADAKDAETALDNIIADNAEKALRAEATEAKGVSDAMYPIGAITASTRASSSSTSNALTTESRIQTVVYNQPYSVVLGNYSGNIRYNNQSGAIFNDDRDSSITIKGLKTAPDAIPMLGNATYNGKAFNGTHKPSFSGGGIIEGKLNYNVNFTNRTGSGSITGLGDTVNLKQGTISGTGISSTAQQSYKNGSYLLDFFGKKADEIAGEVIFDGKDTIGFGGTRGEISK